LPSEKFIVGAREVADWLGVSDRTVRDLADRSIIIRTGRGKYDLRASIAAYTAHLREVSAGRGGETQILDLTEQRARLAKEQADATALKNATTRGELVKAEAVAQEWEGIVAEVRSAMLAIPGRIRRRAGSAFDAAAIALVDQEIREALTALANPDQDQAARPHEGEAAAEDEAVDLD
jgi:Phage DNA packaging protein, Nu1 subunit of terminase